MLTNTLNVCTCVLMLEFKTMKCPKCDRLKFLMSIKLTVCHCSLTLIEIYPLFLVCHDGDRDYSYYGRPSSSSSASQTSRYIGSVSSVLRSKYSMCNAGNSFSVLVAFEWCIAIL